MAGADVLKHIICTVKIRRTPARHDNTDFLPLVTKISEILPLSVVTADKWSVEQLEYERIFD